MRFERGCVPPQGRDAAEAWQFVFRGEDLLVIEGARGAALIPRSSRLAASGLRTSQPHYLGSIDGEAVYASRADEGAPPQGARFEGLRPLFASLGDELFHLAGTAKQIVTWDRDHQFCGRCGAPTRTKSGERAKVCTVCGHLAFPRLSPAIIVAVTRGDRLLMAHADRFPQGMFSVIAGFVEPGETLEECVQREVREETAIEVGSIRYFGSQSWSFPHSLMLAFTASHASGEIVVDGNEVQEARWFRAGEMPRIPDRASISRRLIEWFLAGGSTPDRDRGPGQPERLSTG